MSQLISTGGFGNKGIQVEQSIKYTDVDLIGGREIRKTNVLKEHVLMGRRSR